MNKIVATNRKALRGYEILETLEAGIELKGSEVKGLRQGNANINDSFARIENGEVFLYNSYIASAPQAGHFKTEPEGIRKLLLHRRQIDKLYQSLTQRGYTLIPTKIYFNERGLAKVELALCKGKKIYDIRQSIKEKEAQLKIRRVLKNKKR